MHIVSEEILKTLMWVPIVSGSQHHIPAHILFSVLLLNEASALQKVRNLLLIFSNFKF